MHRLLSLRALGLGAVALALMGAMAWLGRWQLSVYDDHQRGNAQAALREPPVPLETILGPDDAFPADGTGRPVTLSGRFIGAEQLYVRDLAGASRRYAVVTPLQTATGSAVLVVRGARDSLGAPAPRGRVTIRGVLEPSQGTRSPVDTRRVAAGLSVSSLVNAVTPDLYSGYVLLRSSTPAQHPALSPVTPPLPDPSRWSGVRNLLYAAQWWVFAAFVAFMWWRLTDDQASLETAVVKPVEADTAPSKPARAP